MASYYGNWRETRYAGQTPAPAYELARVRCTHRCHRITDINERKPELREGRTPGYRRAGRLCQDQVQSARRGAGRGTTMTDLVQELGKEARKLSPAERIQLVDEILSSLDQTNPTLDSSWAAEVEDRIAAYRRG